MKRALLIVLDSVGIGYAPDAADFGDEGANTLGHIRKAVPDFRIPNLDAAGMAHAEALAAGNSIPDSNTHMSWGCLNEQSAGKDTTTGHWEMAGAPIREAFSTYEKFPKAMLAEMEETSGVTFIGNYAQSGTAILQELGEEHLKTGNPILYTSADSVIQIAAHEEIVPLEKLYDICKKIRLLADNKRIGRVIARPFTGKAGNFIRTANRHDFSIQPPRTILNILEDHGINTVGIGKISDIFAGSGISESFPTKNNADGMKCIKERWQKPIDQPTFYFANLVDFDMLYGHRRDTQGYAEALEEFDKWFGEFLSDEKDSLIMITADHGNDPTWTGTDHTRERVPFLVGGLSSKQPNLGNRGSFSDVARTLAEWFDVPSETIAGQAF